MRRIEILLCTYLNEIQLGLVEIAEIDLNWTSSFYRAMHFSAKRGIAIACRLYVCLSLCDVGGLRSHRLEFFENNFIIS